jgi:signal transduction histidine kinase/CheY-like chemotaxis protein
MRVGGGAGAVRCLEGDVPLSADSFLKARTPLSRASRFAIACAIAAVATILRAAADPLIHDQIPYFIYVAAVVIATWFCGIGGGVVTTFISAFAGNYFFVPPRYEFVPHGEDWTAMALFAVVAFGLVGLVGRWRLAEIELRRQAEQLVALNAEAERVNRVKDEFLATLSHELRTPLNAILGWAQMLDSGRLDAARRKEAVQIILRNVQTQSRLVNDVLDVSRIISGKMHLEMAPVDLSAVVSSALDTIRPAANVKGIEVATSFAPRVAVTGDIDRLRQIAWNLVSNAVKFTPPGGRIEVTTGMRGLEAVFTVEDSGVGIDPAFLPFLFERFRQADSSTTRQHAGLGLGLAIVRHLVELHGGSVKAESAGYDRGATFTVTLPVRPTTASRPGLVVAPVDGIAASRPELTGLRVLAVDDEPDARDLLASALSQFGAEVRTVASVRDALETFARWRPHVLVADVGMPIEDGFDLIRQVRALAPSSGGAVPAVAVTAYAQDEDRVRALSAGFQEHMAKPVLPEELAIVVAQLASRDRLHTGA